LGDGAAKNVPWRHGALHRQFSITSWLILVLSVLISGALSAIPVSASKMDGKGYGSFNTGSHPSAKRFQRFQKTGH
jgi:hypothetical protein